MDDRNAFEQLVQRQQTAVCAVAFSVLRDRGRSEEVAQEAFLIAWLQRTAVTVTPSWICGIARNLARNAARRRKELAMEDDPIDLKRGARDELIAREDAARATAALAELPERYREAIVLYYRSEQSIGEVATALGISEESARQRVHRGRKALRDSLEPVETTVRATRPGAAFTAACVAIWLTRGTVAHAAAAKAATGIAATWATVALLAGSLAVATAVGVATPQLELDHREARSATTVDRRSTLQRRFAPMVAVRHATVPPGFVAVTTTGAATSPAAPSDHTVDLDFSGAPFPDMLNMLAAALDTAIWLPHDSGAMITIKASHMAPLDALDEVLAQAGARRTEVAALRIVPLGEPDAGVFGGEPMTASFHATPINVVLHAIQPHLAMPLGRVGFEVPPGATDDNGAPMLDQSPTVTLELRDTPAGLALQQALDQIGYGYELTTGFVITPDDD